MFPVHFQVAVDWLGDWTCCIKNYWFVWCYLYDYHHPFIHTTSPNPPQVSLRLFQCTSTWHLMDNSNRLPWRLDLVYKKSKTIMNLWRNSHICTYKPWLWSCGRLLGNQISSRYCSTLHKTHQPWFLCISQFLVNYNFFKKKGSITGVNLTVKGLRCSTLVVSLEK